MEYIMSSRLLTTRSGTMVLGGVAAVLAAVILLFYLAQYRSSVNAAHNPMTVLVAKKLIQKGTPGEIIGTEALFTATTVPQAQLLEGGIADPSVLKGRVASADIYPGQQLTATDFDVAATDSIATKIARHQRAISVPIDGTHGLIGHVQTGDHVDVFAGFNVPTCAGQRPVVKAIMRDALVLSAPPAAGGGVASSGGPGVVLRADEQQSINIAWAADNGKLWLVLRPSANVPASRPGVVTADTLLFGVKPVAAFSSLQPCGSGRRP